MASMKIPIQEKISYSDLDVHFEGKRIILASLQIQPQFLKTISKLQSKDSRLVSIMRNFDVKSKFWVREDGILVLLACKNC